LVINYLSPYTTPYIFGKVLTSLRVNDLSPYTNVKGDVERLKSYSVEAVCAVSRPDWAMLSLESRAMGDGRGEF
jgi:hypothetical protein